MQTYTIPQFVGTMRYANEASPTAAEVARRARFLEKYPAQEASILSYQTNPNCQCSRDIVTAISNDPNNAENLSYIAGDTVTITTPVTAIGKIIVIPDTEDAWLALTTRFQTEMFMFRGLTILPGTPATDGTATLRVFFY